MQNKPETFFVTRLPHVTSHPARSDRGPAAASGGARAAQKTAAACFGNGPLVDEASAII